MRTKFNNDLCLIKNNLGLIFLIAYMIYIDYEIKGRENLNYNIIVAILFEIILTYVLEEKYRLISISLTCKVFGPLIRTIITI